MNLSWKIFTAFGIPVRLHFSMLIIPFLAFSWVEGTGVFDLIVASVLTVLLFGSVLLHEFGHALTGRKYGVHTEDIVLTPIGGMARMRNIPTRPKEEIAIAIAGPVVSFAIAGVAFILLRFPIYLPGLTEIVLFIATVLFQLNLALGVFNLVPALPMDGGRVFRGLLALKYDHLKATQIASKIGKILAIAGGLYGIYNGHWTLVFIAVFIYISAGQEERIAQMRDAYEKAKSKGSPFGFPFAGGPFSQSGGSQEPFRQGRYVYQEQKKSSPKDEWNDSVPSSQRPKVVQGGKVEVISRKTPEDKN